MLSSLACSCGLFIDMSSPGTNPSPTSAFQFTSSTLSQGNLENDTKHIIIQKFKHQWDVRQWKNGFFEDSYISEINIHWLKFSQPHTSSFFILGILYIIIMVVGVFGNSLVILLFCRCKSLRTPANTLIVNLAVSDILMLLKMPIFIYNSFHKGPILGDIACRVYGFVGGLSGTASIGTLAAISFDRYFVIRFPLKRYSSFRIYTCLACSWLNALFFSSIPMLDMGLGKYQYEGYLTSCSFDYLTDDSTSRAFIWVFFVAAFLMPMCIIAYSYYKILRVVGGRSNAMSGKRDSLRHVKEEDKRKQEIKLAVIVLVVIFLWLFSWTPYAAVSLLGILGQKHLITPLASMIPALFCKTASAIDPYVYALSHPKFRAEIWKLLGVKEKDHKTRKKRKVWSTKSRHPGNTMSSESRSYYDDGVEEETIEIELKSMDFSRSPSKQSHQEIDLMHEQEISRQVSKANIMCFRPSFSNRPSSFRKISRRLSRSSCREDSARNETFN